MRKVTAHIVLTAVLLGTVISQSLAATDEPGSSVTVTSPGNTTDTLPPEPGTISDTNTDAAGNPSPAIVRNPIDTTAPADAGAAKPNADLSIKGSGETASKVTAAAQSSEYRGKYFGGKFGIVNSSASGTTDAPSASTLSYGLQGGYLQAGYNWDLSVVVVGVGAYVDWNNYAIHSNDIAYASRGFGLDAKLGLPVGDWMPYVKLGYGYSTGTRDINLRAVAQNSSNVAVGVEYNFAPRWSAIAEYKRDSFSNRDSSITINNKLFTFGFNYYFDIPLVDTSKKELAPELDLPIPEPILAPTAIPEAPPPP